MIIYILTFAIIVLIIYLIVVIRDRKSIRKHNTVLQGNLKAVNNDNRILKYNYESLKKVYTSTVRKYNTLDKAFKKFKKMGK